LRLNRYATSNVRSAAFERLAELATRDSGKPATKDKDRDIDRLIKACRRPKTPSSGFLDAVLKQRSPATDESPIVYSSLFHAFKHATLKAFADNWFQLH
jgi:phosphatidylinositol 4-kinase